MAVATMNRGHVNTRNAWVFFGITVVEAIANCALEGVLFFLVASTINIRANAPARTVPTYLAIYILAFVFQAIFTFLAIRQRNTIQIIGLVIFNACFVAYSAVQITEIPDLIQNNDAWHNVTRKMRPILIIIPVITGIAQVAYTYLAYKIYQDFGWLVFKRLGADRKIHRYYFYYEIFACLLKFDFFFFVGFSMQLLILNISFEHIEFWLTLAAIPVAIVFIVMASWGVRNEIHWLQLLFDFGIVAGTGYYGVKLWKIWDDTKGIYENDRKSLTIFASLALVLMVCTFFVSIVCQLNFGKGLRKYLAPQKDKENERYAEYEFDEETSYRGLRSPPMSSQASGQGRVLLE